MPCEKHNKSYGPDGFTPSAQAAMLATFVLLCVSFLSPLCGIHIVTLLLDIETAASIAEVDLKLGYIV